MALTSTRLPLRWREVRLQEVRPRLTATGRRTQSALGAALKGSTQAARNDSEGGSGGRAHAVSSDFECTAQSCAVAGLYGTALRSRQRWRLRRKVALWCAQVRKNRLKSA